MRIAIAHHWFVTRGGGERVAECIAAMFPHAEIFTLVSHPKGIPPTLKSRSIHTSFLQKIPFAVARHRHFLPFYPEAADSLDLRDFDLVISSDSGPIKGIRTGAKTVHICYCHSPARYLYDGYDDYCAKMGWFTRQFFKATAGRVRRWDTHSSKRVSYFIANSRYVADRIQRAYGREAAVINPPIDIHRAVAAAPGNQYLCAGRLVPYKRTDLLIEACNRLVRPLKVIGVGPDLAAMRRLAGDTITFLGEADNKTWWQELASCRALLFAADEDFGMVPLEAQACGRPVIAYGVGGSLETVRGTGDQPTGVFFTKQTVESVMEGIQSFEGIESIFDSQVIREHAEHFQTKVFLQKMRDFILDKVPQAADEMIPVEKITGL